MLRKAARLFLSSRCQPEFFRLSGRAIVPIVALGFLLAASSARSEILINELLFNPPHGDSTNEYVELRGTPNLVLPAGTYLVNVEGDGDGGENPGVVQNVFDLSQRRIGQNGFLVLLQKFHRYRPNVLSAVVTNSDSGGGWGSGSSSSLRHRGEGGQTELENASCTFFLIQSATAPANGEDIDANDDGVPDGPFAGWTVLDSVGILDSSGEGDWVYGLVNFREDREPGEDAGASNTIVPVPFTPGYVARNGNTSDWVGTNWVGSDNLLSRPPTWLLGRNSRLGTNTAPAKRSRAALNHLGGPNFRAPILPSIIVRQTGTNTSVIEGGRADSYLINLSLRPTGAVTVKIEAEIPAQVSVDGGRTFGAERTLTLTSAGAKKVLVRAPNDGAAGPSQSSALITHSVTASLDARFPLESLILPVTATIVDTSIVLLSEAKINPPGVEDAPSEFIEIRGTANALLTNLFVVAVQGNDSGDSGRSDLVVNLNGQRMGTNGLLMIAAAGHPYAFSPGTTVVPAPALGTSGGALDNGTVSILLVGTRQSIPEGVDLDVENNGTLEGLPADAFVVDAIAWKRKDAGNSDEIYGGVDLSQSSFTPDAASRFPGNNAARSPSAWFVGDLIGPDADSLVYDHGNVSTNQPPGSVLTPGVINKNPPRITPNPLPAFSGVIGDPENETLVFTISDDDSPLSALSVSVASTNPAVTSDVILTNFAPGKYRLSVDPIGVGYSEIRIRVHDGVYSRYGFVPYAASEQGRPGAKWHSGVSDASTAMPIDAHWMFIGDDENQVLRIYSRTSSGGPVAGKDFSPLLGKLDLYPDGTPREVDIEGSTRVGNRIYWLGSHSHAFNATERTNRARLFATDRSGSGTNTQLKLISHYDFLKLDLLGWDANNVHGKGANYYGFVDSAAEGKDPKASDGSGFNLEGLCMVPGPNNTTNAYIAFRAPLVPPTGDDARSRALLIPVLNFGKLATKSSGPGSAQFGTPVELNLGGRGVRSIEGVGTNYLIIAGPPGAGDNLPPPGNFKLFTWTGLPGDVPEERGANMTGLNAEAIVEVMPGPWAPTNLFQIVSDNGTNRYYGDDVQAKFLEIREFKKFRMDTIALGEIVATPAPAIRSFTAASDGVTTVSWFAKEGTAYRVQAKSELDAAWTDLPEEIIATNSVARKSLTSPATQSFFRVIAAP